MKKAILIFVLAYTSNYKFSTAQVVISQSQLSICAGSSTVINVSGADSYFWSPSSGLNTTIGNSVTASPLITTTYSVTGFDSFGNTTGASVEVFVNPNPVLSIDMVQPGSCNYIDGLYLNPIYSDIKITKDIVYGQNYLYNGQLKDLKLDIYKPNQLVNYKRPAILVLHGGGFLFGNKEDSVVVKLSLYYSSRGYVVYNANYRIGMVTPNQLNAGKAYYRAVQDAKSCVRFIRKTGTDIGVDTSQIFITGVSAGALTSIATAYLDQNEIPSFINYSALGLLEDASGNLGYSSKVSAVVSISGGVYDTTTIFDNETEPLYSFHGTEDNVIPYYSGMVGGLVLTYGGFSVNKAANESGLNSTLHTFVNGGHVPPIDSPEMDSVLYESGDFLYSQVKYKHGENTCAMILVSGGSQYNWAPTAKLSNPYSNQLIATPNFLTTYTLTSTDSNGCFSQSSIEIKSAIPLFIAIKVDTVYNHLNLYPVAGGGQSPYNFLWSNGSTIGIMNHVAPGIYSVTVTSGDCNRSDEVQILYPDLIKPSNLMALDITSCGAKFSWEVMPHSLYQRAKLTNLSDNSVVLNLLGHTQGIFEYAELIPGTNYRFEITDFTYNDSTAGASVYEFKTNKCEAPLHFTEYNIGANYAAVQWNVNCNPDAYRFKFRAVGDSIWNIIGTTISNVNLYNLNPGTTYEYVVRTICISGSNYSQKSETGYFTTPGQKIENVSFKVKPEIQVYPNPSNGTFTVKADLPESVACSEIEIVNGLGEIIYQKNIRTEDGNINESIKLNKNLSNGVYELRVKNGVGYLENRFVIKQ